MKNKQLAIAIPTYNRALILKENLELMMEEIRKYSVPIYISDDSLDNNTKSVIDEFHRDYEYFYYYKNQPGLGHDKNCLKTLALPSEEYIWYLGDSNIIKSGGIKKVLEIINTKKFDFISVNEDNRNIDVSSGIYADGNQLIVDIGWHLTMTSTTIYFNSIQKTLEELDLVKCKNFPQTALIFESFAKGDAELYWINDPIICSNLNKKSYWSNTIFDVFLKDWDFFISNLPIFYTDKNKGYVIKKHSEESGLFTFRRFLYYRSIGIYSFRIFVKYFRQIRFNSRVNIFLLMLISITPKGLLYFIKKNLKII